MKITRSGAGVSEEIQLNTQQSDFKVSLSVNTDVNFSGTCTVEMRLDDVWVEHEFLRNLTDNAVSNIFFPVNAVRLSVTGTGDVSLITVQGA